MQTIELSNSYRLLVLFSIKHLHLSDAEGLNYGEKSAAAFDGEGGFKTTGAAG
jgi:hypothetical protein